MSTTPSRAIAAFAVLALLAIPPPAVLAQDVESVPVPLLEVSGGYMFMRDFNGNDALGEDLNFPAGWYASGAVNLSQWFGLVGEGAGSYKNDYDFVMDGLTFSNRLRVYTFMGGPRFFRKVGRVAPFGQMLVGAAHMRAKTALPDEYIEIFGARTLSDTATNFAMQPGGGVTVFLTERVGVRAQADYRSIIDFAGDNENEYMNEFRFITGFTLHWGGR